MLSTHQIIIGDATHVLQGLHQESIQCCITSPPYWGLRDYGDPKQIGLEDSPEAYVQKLVLVFDELWRVLKPHGTLWLNLGDSYWRGQDHKAANPNGETKNKFNPAALRAGGKNHPIFKRKDLVGIPWRVAIALQASGWYLRQDIIWHKTNAKPESVKDRCTRSHEYLFLLSKSPVYYYDHQAIREPVKKIENYQVRDGKYQQEEAHASRNAETLTRKPHTTANKRSIWSIPTAGYPGAHYAVFPDDLVKPCVLAGTQPGDTVLDPFSGSGTTGKVAAELGRNYIGIELNPAYAKQAERRTETFLFKHRETPLTP